jgi:hypothetical protein
MPTKVIVQYEDTIKMNIGKVFDLTMQWLHGQHKPKIGKKTNPPFYIEAKQGTMNASTGYDPVWKKNIRINFFDMEGKATLVRVIAQPIARNIRSSKIEKLKMAWWNGLFSSLFSLLVKMEGGPRKEVQIQAAPTLTPTEDTELKARFCPNCGKKIEQSVDICPDCGTEVN